LAITPPGRGFISHVVAGRWEEALISGNGRMGTMAMSRALDEQIILSHEKLFVPIHLPLDPIDQASRLGEISKMMSKGEYQKAADLTVKLADEAGYGGKRWTDPFIPACDLLVSTKPSGKARGYARSLDYATGVASVSWSDDSGEFARRVFVSRPDNAIVMSLGGPKGKLNCALKLDQHPVDGYDYWDGPGKIACLEGFRTTADVGWLVYTDEFKLTDGGYAVVARVTTKGGRGAPDGGKLIVEAADEVLAVLRIVVLDRFAGFDAMAIKDDLTGLPDSFDALLKPHAKAHGEIFLRMSLDLGGGADRNEPAEKLWQRSHDGDLSPALLEKIFDSGRYAILSSCGDWPPNLQGVWAGTWGPPWSGDYTVNGNVQAAIASLLNGNMPECLHSFFNYLEWLVPHSRTNARRLYDCGGIFLASRTSTHGLQNHFDETWPMTFWTPGAAWCSQFFYDYYLYTGDREFLAKRALPYMKECAAFFEDFLIEDKNGKLLFSPSYSPENNPSNSESQACVNATMDIAIVKELLTNLIAACEELGVEQDGVARWKAMLARMPAYMINKDGAVKEWTTPDLDDNYRHRHCSHLYPLYNGIAPDIAADPRILEGFRKAMDYRIEVRKREKGGGVMAFGLIQLGLSASSLGDADTVSLVIDRLAGNYYFRSLASSHDPGEIFNTDISGGLPAVIIKSLVHSQPGIIEILPACPSQMSKGRIQGVLCRGQVKVVDMAWEPGKIDVTLESAKDQTVEIKLSFEPGVVELADGEASIEWKAGSRVVRAELSAGKSVTMRIAWQPADGTR